MEPFDASIAQDLHRRLLDGDPTASAELAELLIPLVVRKLWFKFPHIDDVHLIDEAVHSALLEYFRHPDKYEPSRSNLLTFIHLAAYRDLINLLKSEKRHKNAIAIEEHVVDAGSEQEYTVDVADDFELEPEVIARIITHQRLDAWIPDSLDLRVVYLLMENVRETVAYSELLGISGLPISEQEKIVKAHKDRLKKLLKRRWRAIEMEEND